ncbi:LytR C-terminal domain-containing protein [Patescibacteria group bacterium]
MPKKKEEDKKRVKVEVVEESTDEKEKPTDETKEEKLEVDSKETKEEETPKEDKEVSEDNKENKEKEEHKGPESDKLPFWILFFAFLIGLTLGAGLIGGIFYYKSKVENNIFEKVKPESTVTPTIEEKEDVEATAEPEADLSVYKLQILNGSGIKGEASKVDALVKSAGFGSTSTGNADSYNYETTEISYKEKVTEDAIKTLKESLSDYETKAVGDLDEDSDYDIVIIVGSS